MSRSVLITGGNRGIGLAIAQCMAGEGHRVTVTYNNSPAPEGLGAVKCDVTDVDSIKAAFAEVKQQQGAVEVLVTAAGITRDAMAIRMNEQQWDDVVDTNLKGAAFASIEALRGMAFARWGRIILIGSVGAARGVPGQLNYTAAKAGLVGMGRTLAREYAARGVTVNIVAPGLTETDMVSTIPAAQLDKLIADIPLGRMTKPQEVAAAVSFLASDDASAITGAYLAVDGGAATGH